MSLLRRRMLMAASSAKSEGGDFPWGDLPAESTSFGFPLYLNATDKSWETDFNVEYYRQGDSVSEAFREWVMERLPVPNLAYEFGDNEQVYINGEKVAWAVYSMGVIELGIDRDIAEITLDIGGDIYIAYFK